MIQSKAFVLGLKSRPIRLFSQAVVFSACAAMAFAPSAMAGGMSKSLAGKIASASAGEQVSVIVQLPKFPALKVDTRLKGKDRARAMINGIKASAEAARMRLMGDVTYKANRGDVSKVKPLWLANAVAMDATPAAIAELMAAYPEASVTVNRPIKPLAGSSTRGSINNVSGVADDWNLTSLQATDMWNLGYKGQDVVVAFMDTGIDVDHPALAVSAFEGGAESWCDTVGAGTGCPGLATPSEVTIGIGHGTSVTSVLFGDTVADPTSGQPRLAVGVAPEARWIGVRLFDDEGNATEADAIQGLQWLAGLANPPRVINMSWAVINSPADDGTCVFKDLTGGTADPLRIALADLRSTLGIFLVASSGNEAVPVLPAAFHEVYAVGAIGPDNTIWQDTVNIGSGQWPSGNAMNCDGRNAALADTTMTFKPYPDVVAPGETIIVAGFSSGGIDDTGIKVTGTSYSAPHAAGAAALLLSAFPDMVADDLEKILSFAAIEANGQTTGVIDNVHGYGVLKAKGALDIAMTFEIGLPADDYYQLARAPKAWLTQSGGDVTVNWTAPPTPAGVTVDYTITKNGLALTSAVSGASYTDTGAGASTIGYYQVVVHDAAGNVPDSAATVALLGNINRMGGATAERVDGFDLMAMRNAVATGSTDTAFDLNGDTNVTAADMTILEAQMGHRVTP